MASIVRNVAVAGASFVLPVLELSANEICRGARSRELKLRRDEIIARSRSRTDRLLPGEAMPHLRGDAILSPWDPNGLRDIALFYEAWVESLARSKLQLSRRREEITSRRGYIRLTASKDGYIVPGYGVNFISSYRGQELRRDSKLSCSPI